VLPGQGGEPQFPVFNGALLDNPVERRASQFGVSMLFALTHYF